MEINARKNKHAILFLSLILFYSILWRVFSLWCLQGEGEDHHHSMQVQVIPSFYFHLSETYVKWGWWRGSEESPYYSNNERTRCQLAAAATDS